MSLLILPPLAYLVSKVGELVSKDIVKEKTLWALFQQASVMPFIIPEKEFLFKKDRSRKLMRTMKDLIWDLESAGMVDKVIMTMMAFLVSGFDARERKEFADKLTKSERRGSDIVTRSLKVIPFLLVLSLSTVADVLSILTRSKVLLVLTLVTYPFQTEADVRQAWQMSYRSDVTLGDVLMAGFLGGVKGLGNLAQDCDKKLSARKYGRTTPLTFYQSLPLPIRIVLNTMSILIRFILFVLAIPSLIFQKDVDKGSAFEAVYRADCTSLDVFKALSGGLKGLQQLTDDRKAVLKGGRSGSNKRSRPPRARNTKRSMIRNAIRRTKQPSKTATKTPSPIPAKGLAPPKTRVSPSDLSLTSGASSGDDNKPRGGPGVCS